MTKEREALKKMLDALRMPCSYWNKTQFIKVQEAIKAGEEALAQPEQEPVAVKHMMEWVDYLKRKSDYGQHLQIPSEMSAGACWDLARELEQFINTTPPQRPSRSDMTWVGLTDDEVNELVEHTECEDYYGLVEATEAKLKEKNT